MALACLVLVSCPQPKQPETWEEIKTFKGLDGTWATTFDSGEDGEDLAKDFSSIATVYSANAFITIKGEKIQQYNSISIDMTAEIDKGLETAPAGVEADVLWEALKNYWITASNAYDDMEFSFSSGRPYLIILTSEPYTVSEEDLFFEDEYDSSKWCVNNTKTKLKNIITYRKYDEETGEPLLDENGNPVMVTEEMILVKK
ncbi:MAG: hypothetical protein E7062_10430 [Spirochaetaceae bacterium]|nr:hypothetical protein [Spirochaetaceae bacterium]